ncbi:MAG TPA: acetyl-CoA carboxylase biotin carboxyl carrier protein [Pyrinomonadaceae bacterium]|nr:acetyl-CoA carboxylase biotin carboxyl carrier protein [Pyrinomonadaceae bacterium]
MSDNTASAKANKSDQPKDPSFNMNELRELAELVNEHGFTDFEFENENIRVRLSKAAPAAPVQTAAPVSAAPATAPTPTTAPLASEQEAPAADSDAGLFKITSPIVGTFYSSPGPDKEPYVKIGSKVSPESVVCIVEAMKLMNEIQAEASGEVVKVYVENGQPVEYGQPLFGIK